MIEGQRILNFIILIFVGLFSILNFLYFGPVIKSALNKDFNNNTIKGYICTVTPFNLTENDDLQKAVSVKPKLIICAFGNVCNLKNVSFYIHIFRFDNLVLHGLDVSVFFESRQKV